MYEDVPLVVEKTFNKPKKARQSLGGKTLTNNIFTKFHTANQQESVNDKLKKYTIKRELARGTSGRRLPNKTSMKEVDEVVSISQKFGINHKSSLVGMTYNFMRNHDINANSSDDNDIVLEKE